MVAIWFLLTLLSLLKRPDFVDLTFCGICVYGIISRHFLNKRAYWVATIGALFSLFFDLVFLVVFSEFYWHKVQGWDMDLSVRRFVIIINYIKLVIKIFLLPLLWKITIDFEETVRYKHSQGFQDKQGRSMQQARDKYNVHYAEFADSEMGDEKHIYDNV